MSTASRDQIEARLPFTDNPVLESELEMGATAPSVALPKVDEDRLRSIIAEHFEVAWRFLRRLGIPESEVDDAMQEVVLVMARKLDAVRPGSERAFLLSTAFRVASSLRRLWKRRREVGEEPLAELVSEHESPEKLTERWRERKLLDRVLEELPLDVRGVFVLYELEEMTMSEIASTLALAPGTVASRLRRGRERFEALATAALEQQGNAHD